MCLPDEVHSKLPDVPVDEKPDDPALIATEEVCHILDNKGMIGSYMSLNLCNLVQINIIASAI